MTEIDDWSSLSIKLESLNKTLAHQLNEKNYKAAFETAHEITNIGVKLQIWTFKNIDINRKLE